MTSSQWERACNGTDDALDVLKEALGRLGLRARVSEPTSRAVTAAVVLCTEEDAKIMTMTDRDLKPLYLMVKAALRKQKGTPPIMHLPETPHQLKTQNPQFYAELYGNGEPSKCPFP